MLDKLNKDILAKCDEMRKDSGILVYKGQFEILRRGGDLVIEWVFEPRKRESIVVSDGTE